MNSFVLEWNENNKAGNISFHKGKVTVKRPGYYFVYNQMYHYNDNRYRLIVLVILTTSKKN